MSGNQPSILLHIGFPKTGTTSLQFMLKMSAEQLAGSGCDVLAVYADHLGGHHGILQPLSKHGRERMVPRQEMGFTNAFVSGVTFDPKMNYILSSEDLSRIHPEELLRLKQVAPTHQILVFACVRPQVESIPRVWGTSVLHYGLSTSIREIYEDSGWLFEYFRILDSIAGIVGWESISVVNFAALESPVNCQFRTITDILGLSILSSGAPELNASLPLGLLRIVRSFNRAGSPEPVQWIEIAKRWPRDSARRSMLHALSLGDFVRIHQMYFEDNRELHRRFGIDLNGANRTLLEAVSADDDLGTEVSYRDIMDFVKASTA
jgi:hypothetical protein